MALPAKKSAQSEPKPMVVLFRVILKEIDRLYDLTPGCRIGEVQGQPDLVFRTPKAGSILRQASWHDRNGEPVPSPKSEGRVWCQMEYEGTSACSNRTFLRKRSGHIGQGKRVYVFQAVNAAGKEPLLLHELEFGKDGRFRRVAPTAWGAGKDVREPGTKESTDLSLAVWRIGAGPLQRAHYFFYLAPYALPWDAVEAIQNDLPRRATHLWDDLYTDAYEKDPASAEPLLVLRGKDAVPDNGSISYVLHLVDPFKEALLRAQDYSGALDRIEALLGEKAKNPKYVLAKRIELLVSNDEMRQSYVKKELHEFLREQEPEWFCRTLAPYYFVEQLLRWIGREMRRKVMEISRGNELNRTLVAFSNSQLSYYHPLSRDPSTASLYGLSGEQPWSNPFPDAVRDYQSAPLEVRQEVQKIVVTVQSRLEQTPPGLAWMRENLNRPCVLKALAGDDEKVDGKKSDDSQADGGLAFLLDVKAWSENASEALGYGLKIYTNAWVRKYGDTALKEFRQWLAKRGVHLELKNGRLALTARSLERAKVDEGIKAQLDLAVKAINFLDAMRKADRKDPWTWAEMASAAAELHDTFRDTHDTWQVIQYGQSVKLQSYAKWGFVATGVGAAVELRDLRRAWRKEDDGEITGHLVKTLGVGLSVVGGTLGAPAVPLALAVWALSYAGERIVAEMNDTSLFLRYCEFGEEGGKPVPEPLANPLADPFMMGAVVNDPSYTNRFWYKGSLNELKKNYPLQLRLLDQLMFHFVPRIELENVGGTSYELVLYLELRNPFCFTKDAVWEVYAYVQPEGEQRARDIRLAPAEVIRSKDEPNLLKIKLTRLEGFMSPVFGRTHGEVKTTALVKLKTGAASEYIERKIEKTETGVSDSWRAEV